MVPGAKSKDGHRSLVTPERVLSGYNEDFVFYFLFFCKLP